MSDARTLGPINYEWRGEVTNAEMNALHAEAFETRVYGENEWDWNEQMRGHSLGWVVARDDDGTLLGFVNIPWDGLVHAWIQDTMVASVARHRGIGDQGRRARCRRASPCGGCEWMHVDFEDHLGAFYFDACGFTLTNGGLIEL